MESDEWREILRECIVYGLLFKAVARDANTLDMVELKMTYRPILDAISVWAERRHHDYRRQFGRIGGKIRSQETRDGFLYVVLVTFRGVQHENVYNVEILRAECQDRLNNFLRTEADRA
ncbi:hypothetical protein [Brevibacillus agri]|uniref:hypothetical protein n=1 Tax=Brevibacillus agri TaxID=51101 RepID=UPI0018CE75A3|nr:hypothetical protein [Brevibacillus agri]MBG9564899.1 hypothetical protein [Brevibacillus agri]